MLDRAGNDTAIDAELAALAPWLDRIPAPEPAPDLVGRTQCLAVAELARAPSLLPGVRAASTRLPACFGAELARVLATALPAIAVGAGWATLLLRLGPGWLSAWLPADLALALVIGPAVAAWTALGLASGCLPLVAHHRALLRTRGMHA